MCAVSPQDDFVSQSSSRSNGGEVSQGAVIANLKELLATERQARRHAEECLRDTHAAMIKHQQVGRMGDFRYNTRTKESRRSLDSYKLFGFDRSLGACDFATRTDKIHPDDKSRLVKMLFDATSPLAPLLLEYRIEIDGQTRYIRTEGLPDRDYVGDVVYFSVVTDITERRAMEESLRRAEAELAASRRLASMGELAGSIVHEINQPLAAIATSADACRRWIAADSNRRDRAIASLDGVIAESERATAVVAGLKSLIRDSRPKIGPLDHSLACQLRLHEGGREDSP